MKMKNPIPHGEPRRRVWAALREGVALPAIADYLGWEEIDFRWWLQEAAPPSWRGAYLFGQREIYRQRLKGLPPEVKKAKLREWDEKHNYVG